MSVTARAIWYIESHLQGGDLSLDAVASAAAVSPYHLSRAFSWTVGRPLTEYVRARRLSEAARALAAGAPDILAVALEAGYGSHEAFTRAFRSHFGVTPEQVRAAARADVTNIQEAIPMDLSPTATHLERPQLVDGAPMLLFGISQEYEREADSAIPLQWNTFAPHIGHIEGQVGPDAYGVVLHRVGVSSYIYFCGVAVRAVPVHADDFAPISIPAQRYAIFQHREHISSIRSTFRAIWDFGLTGAGLRSTDGPIVEHYGPKFDGRTGLGGVGIWIPVEG